MTRTSDEVATRDLAPTSPDRPGRFVGAAIGVLSAAVAMGVAQLAAGFIGGAASPVIAVGGSAIDAAPEWLKSFAIRTFGSHDKLALLTGIWVVLFVVAAIVGIASIRRPWVGVIALVGFGAVGALAAVTRPANGPIDMVPSLVGIPAGLVSFAWLRRAAGLPPIRATGSEDVEPDQAIQGFDRRRFLWTGVAAAGLAAVSGQAGRFLIRRADASNSRAAVRLPTPVDRAPATPAGADLGVPGVGPFITPNDRFYRVDTALFVPALTTAAWQLRIHGMVEREITLTYPELLRRPLIERDVTLTCVSNQVGGRYIGNARWLGAPLKDLLDEVGVMPGATQLVSRSSDGFTAGTPTSVVMDGRDAMLAISMNGEPLPLEHGFPVRMVVPGLYGYVSATKWLVDLELTTFQAYDAYWVKRGWAQQAPIKTESRIDTPQSGSTLRAGQVTIAGVAWAQHRGIDRVEVRVDDAPWVDAELATEDTIDTWRQWRYRWDAPAGDHTLMVRATDGDGQTQPETIAPPFPNGATGYHTIQVHVS